MLLIKAFEGDATWEIISSAEEKSTNGDENGGERLTMICRKQNCWTGEQMLFHVSSNGFNRKERLIE